MRTQTLTYCAFLVVVAAGVGCSAGSAGSDGNAPPLSGRLLSSNGDPVVGVPIRAHRQDSNVTVTVYSNQQGRYAFREMATGPYTLSIRVAEFEPVERAGVHLTPQEPVQLDFDLLSRPPAFEELTTSELLLAFPVTEELQATAARCSNCHPMQLALGHRLDGDQWLQTIEKMRGINNNGTMRPEEEVRALLERDREANEKLADDFASMWGPDSPEPSYQPVPRPEEDASTGLVVTTYQIPRGDTSVTFRGDRRGVWPHDVIADPNSRYVWYTDHFTNVLGRLDPETGEFTDYAYPQDVPRHEEGAHKLLFDKDGNIWLGQNWQNTLVKFDPRTEQFEQWTNEDPDAGRYGMFGIGPDGTILAGSNITVDKLDPATGLFTRYPVPSSMYGVDVDSKGIAYICERFAGKVARLDPATGEVTEFEPPTADSEPRRLDIDAQDRIWFAEFKGGNIGMLDPETGEIREWRISDNPYAAPYDVAVDNYNNTVWTNDFNSNRVYRFDMETEQITEFLLPEPDVEIRHLWVDGSTTPATVWIPDYSPPGQILKLQAW